MTHKKFLTIILAGVSAVCLLTLHAKKPISATYEATAPTAPGGALSTIVTKEGASCNVKTALIGTPTFSIKLADIPDADKKAIKAGKKSGSYIIMRDHKGNKASVSFNQLKECIG